MESANFSIHSSATEKKTRNLLLHLEALQGALVGTSAQQSKLQAKPTKILVIGRSSDFKKLNLPEDYVGLFYSDLRGNYIIIGNHQRMSQSQVILHEFVHFMVRTTQSFPFPKWWDEGFADYAAGSELSKKRFDFGLINDGRIADYSGLRLMPWEELLGMTSISGLSKKEGAAYYAQSWFLVHFLHNRQDQRPLHESWALYLQTLQDGGSPVEAFERGFDLTIDQLKKDLALYRRGGRFQYLKIPLDNIVGDFNPSVTTVSRLDIQIELGRFALVARDENQSRKWFSAALKEDPENVAASTGLAATLAVAGDLDAAEMQFNLALEKTPNNTELLVDFAKFEFERASSQDAWFTGRDHIEEAERLLLKARSIDGSSVEIDTLLAAAWLSLNEDPEPPAKLLFAVIKRAPSEQWARLLLADALYRAGELDGAVDIANSVIRYDHGESDYSASARRLIAKIRGNDNDQMRARPKIAAPQLPSDD